MTSPVPTRPAAIAINRAAPVIARDAATTTRTPEARLCVSGSRDGSQAATSEGSVSHARARTRSSGKPMSTTRTMPACSAPGIRTAPSFTAPNVTVSRARTASPSTTPVVPFTPEGMSTATIGTPASLRLAIAAAQSSSGMPRNPVPKIASTATSARASSRWRLPWWKVRRRMPGTSSRRRAFVAAGSRSSPGSSRRTTVVRTPARPRCRAATSPSPPLFPFPHTTTARRP